MHIEPIYTGLNQPVLYAIKFDSPSNRKRKKENTDIFIIKFFFKLLTFFNALKYNKRFIYISNLKKHPCNDLKTILEDIYIMKKK